MNVEYSLKLITILTNFLVNNLIKLNHEKTYSFVSILLQIIN